MYENKQHSLSYKWSDVVKVTPGLRSNELVTRIRWFINMRWFAILACEMGALAAFLEVVPGRVNPVYFAVTGAFLTVANCAYALMSRKLFQEGNRQGEVKTFLIVQMLIDFFALSVLTYACGSVETPIATLFMAHVILATIFFRNKTAIAIVLAACFFASLPLVLEWAKVIPTLSIFGTGFKTMITSSARVTGGFVAGIGGTFLICWYLVNTITRSLKQRELDLEDAYKLLVDMDKEKTQATLRATHELKAPFAAIKSYVYTMRDGYAGELPEKAHAVVSRIGDRCDQITQKITDIIHLSNLRTLVIKDMDFAPHNLMQVVSEEVREGALAGKPRGIEVALREGEGGESAYVMGSLRHLSTLFSNLIQNAVSYSLDQGRVEVVVSMQGRRASVSVRDNGIGIPEKNLDKIFDEHFRAKNAVAHHQSGTGLGLSMVKEIVRLHGARINVESTVGKGSVFTVSFDTVEPKQQRGENG